MLIWLLCSLALWAGGTSLGESKFKQLGDVEDSMEDVLEFVCKLFGWWLPRSVCSQRSYTNLRHKVWQALEVPSTQGVHAHARHAPVQVCAIRHQQCLSMCFERPQSSSKYRALRGRLCRSADWCLRRAKTPRGKRTKICWDVFDQVRVTLLPMCAGLHFFRQVNCLAHSTKTEIHPHHWPIQAWHMHQRPSKGRNSINEKFSYKMRLHISGVASVEMQL